MRYALVGGGTGGAATPLIAIAAEITRRSPHSTFFMVGTRNGPEKALALHANIDFFSVHAGKLRRYFSFQNISDFILTIIGFIESFQLLRREKPNCVISVGSFVAVPVMWASRIRGIPCIIHQQDVNAGLSNRLCTPVATAITVTFKESLLDFPKKKTRWIGNPIRSEILTGSKVRGFERFNLHTQLPVILAFGGGTGSQHINQLVSESSLNLVKRFQILHLTGSRQDVIKVQNPNYHAHSFLADNMADAYAVSDIVICRAGLSTLTEIGVLGKPAIVIPLPRSHQEANAAYFKDRNAILCLEEQSTSREQLERTIVDLYNDKQKMSQLSSSIRKLVKIDATSRFVDATMSIVLPNQYATLAKKLRDSGSTILRNEPLNRHSHFKIGGPADLYITCPTAASIVKAIRCLRELGVPYTIIGGGTNLVFPDQGIRGAVVECANTEFERIDTDISVGAGIKTGVLVKRCHAEGLVGIEFLVGIYGTIGGAVRGNAGSFNTEIKDVLVSCQVLTESGKIETWDNERFQFGYRDSIAKHVPLIILTARLKLQYGNVDDARRRVTEYIAYKRERQPISVPSAGCMFKNYTLKPTDHELRDRFTAVRKGDAIPAWAFIKEIGFAGKRIGDIQISEQHANFFVNLGNGTADQVVSLASSVKQQVRDTFGVQLEEEVQYIGFN